MTREDLIRAIIETVSPSYPKKITLTRKIGPNLWKTDTKRMKALAAIARKKKK